jgi:hypothetical protein
MNVELLNMHYQPEVVSELPSPPSLASNLEGDVPASRLPVRWHALTAGAAGALVATLCCLPAATAVAIGLSLGTAAALSELLIYRPLFIAAGLGISALILWRSSRGQHAACRPEQRRQIWDHAVTFGLIGFAAAYVVLNQLVVRLLYELPWLLR